MLALNGLGITPNQVTVSACAGSLLLGSGLAFAVHVEQPLWFLLLPLWLLARMALNAIDGMLARECQQQSTLGTYLNELCDLASDASLYLPFSFIPGISSALIILIIFLSNLAEMAGVLGSIAANGRCNDGPMGKSDRAFVFGALGLLLGAGATPGMWLSWTLSIIALLLAITISNRIRRGVAESNESVGT